ncbi:hypothetical protein GG344DRAFT_71299 [Lentinula edodes]|nr:hypothetical protein GG344DRAFT_71299 [Lentinula edodes]
MSYPDLLSATEWDAQTLLRSGYALAQTMLITEDIGTSQITLKTLILYPGGLIFHHSTYLTWSGMKFETTEAHPFSAFPPSPSRMLDRPNQGNSPVKRSTASMENLFDFSEAMEIEIPDRVFTEEEAREFARSVDLAEEEQGIEGSVVLGIQLLHEQLTQHLSASANSDISNPVTADSALVTDEPPSQDTLIISASSSTQSHSKEPISSFLHNSNDSDFPPPQPPYPSSTTPPFIWNPGKTETRLVNGSMRACCLGRGCAGKAGATINTNCSFKLCKPCCGKYQAEMNITCKEASHKPQAKTSTSGTDQLPMYLHTRPLLPQHYQRREQARIDHQERSTILENRQSYADDIRQKVYIKFWDENGTSDILTTECKTYPFFCLADCSVAVREAIGATEGRMVKTFDPRLRTWILQESTNKQLLQDGEILLIRSRVCQSGEGMKEAEAEEINRKNPHKRRYEQDVESYLIPTMPSTPRRHISHPEPLVSFSPTPQLIQPLATTFPRDLSNSPDLPSIINTRPTTPTPAPKKVKRTHVEEPSIPLATIDLTGSNSRHGNWPWKSYQRMHDGFVKLAETGGKHSDVFPVTSNKTRSVARAAWAAGSVELKAKFRTNPASTWKEYVKEVRTAHGGFIPSYTTQKVKVEKVIAPTSSKVKQEVAELQIDGILQHEVIEIESD